MRSNRSVDTLRQGAVRRSRKSCPVRPPPCRNVPVTFTLSAFIVSYVEAFERKLLALDPEAVDFVLKVDELVSQAGDEHGAALVPSIFRFFAANPLADIGLPGTLVHFTEHFYPSYKPLLMESLRNSPSAHTVLMANRILNSKLNATERADYLEALRSAAQNPFAAPEVREQASHFVKYQHERG